MYITALTWSRHQSGVLQPCPPAIPPALLNEAATLFRCKYYLNGSHAGFIMYMTDPAQS